MLDFRAVCEEYRISIIDSGHHHCHEGWLQTHCPFCTDGTHGWHLGFSLEKGNFNCWRCGSHRVWEVLQKLLRTQENARDALYKYQRRGFKPPPKVEPRQKTLWVPPNMESLGHIHCEYLRKRKFIPEKLEKIWELKGTIYLSENWSWKICFPIYDQTKKIVAYGGRSINDHVKPKIQLSHKEQMIINPSSILYGIHLVKESVVIVEGPTDVWRLGPGAVAVWGIDWKLEQAMILKNYSRRFVMFDPESEAQKRAEKLAEWLGMYSGETELITGLETDPGDLSQREADKIMRDLEIN